jgi:hypothetical protein
MREHLTEQLVSEIPMLESWYGQVRSPVKHHTMLIALWALCDPGIFRTSTQLNVSATFLCLHRVPNALLFR